jgi:hypothetical protein
LDRGAGRFLFDLIDGSERWGGAGAAAVAAPTVIRRSETLSEVPHNAFHDAIALRGYVLAEERWTTFPVCSKKFDCVIMVMKDAEGKLRRDGVEGAIDL